jgi:outer membrane lipoprotein
MEYMKRFIVILMGILLLSGCAHVVSKNLRDKTDKNVSLSQLFQDPENYKGKIVMIGGIIAGASNRREGTFIEVVEKPLDYRGRPQVTDQSLGRFLIVHQNYLDPVIYTEGRAITVAGEILGEKVKPLQEMLYSYPLIQAMEIHLINPGYGVPIHIGIGVGVAVD